MLNKYDLDDEKFKHFIQHYIKQYGTHEQQHHILLNLLALSYRHDLQAEKDYKVLEILFLFFPTYFSFFLVLIFFH
eukprot:UN03470